MPRSPRIYLNEREPTREEIAKGINSLTHYMKEVASYSPLSLQQEAELTRSIKKGDTEARNYLVKSNLRFVMSVAMQYRGRGLSLEELISAGNFGLMTAAGKFDETRGYKFITYAVWWIRQKILQTLAENRTVRLPANRVSDLYGLRKITSSYTQTIGRTPNASDIAREAHLEEGIVAKLLEDGRNVLSLDETFEEDDENNLFHTTPDEHSPSPEEEYAKKELSEKIRRGLSTINEREAEIIRLYYGLDRIEPMTLEEIGTQFGLTRERIRQLRDRALRKLRHPNRGLRLKHHYNESQ